MKLSLLFLFSFLILNYHSSAQEVEWVTGALVDNTSQCFDIACDDFGNSYATGSFYKGNAIFGNIKLTNASMSYDGFIVKLNSKGEVVWAKRAGSIKTDGVTSVGCDTLGNVYFCGFSEGKDFYFGTQKIFSNNNSKSFIIKCDSLGNIIWAKLFADESYTDISDIAVSKDGNISFTGYFMGDSCLLGTKLLQNKTIGNSAIFIAKCNTNGEVIWAKKYSGNNNDKGITLKLDNKGNLYVGCTYLSDTLLTETGLIRMTNSFNTVIFKLDPNGKELWVKHSGGIKDLISEIAIEKNGNVYVLGEASYNINIETKEIRNNELNNYIIKYSESGEFIFARFFEGVRFEGMCFDQENQLAIIGSIQKDSISFDNLTIKNNTENNEGFVFKFDSKDKLYQVKEYQGESYCCSTKMATDNSNNYYVYGIILSSRINKFGSKSLILQGDKSSFFVTKISNKK